MGTDFSFPISYLSDPFLIVWPCHSHVTVGVGSPSTLHARVTFDPSCIRLTGPACAIRGGHEKSSNSRSVQGRLSSLWGAAQVGGMEDGMLWAWIHSRTGRREQVQFHGLALRSMP